MKKRKPLILFGIFTVILVGLISLYCIRAGALLNGRNEETIINSLSEDKENPIEILAIERYEDYIAILYKDPIDAEEADDYTHFKVYKKSRLYKNYYISKGHAWGNMTSIDVCEIERDEQNTVKCFIYDIASEEKTCIVYENDMENNDVRKLDEFEVSQTDFIIVKEYKLLHSMNSVSCANGSQDYEREFNDNYEETNRKFHEEMEKLDEEAQAEYRKNTSLLKRVYGEFVSICHNLWNEL